MLEYCCWTCSFMEPLLNEKLYFFLIAYFKVQLCLLMVSFGV